MVCVVNARGKQSIPLKAGMGYFGGKEDNI